MNKQQSIQLKTFDLVAEPFPYFTAAGGFGEDLSSTVLAWLESDVPWKLVETDFYEQYEFNLLDIELPPDFDFLGDSAFQNDLRIKMESIFGGHLSDRIDCTIHKLMPGQRIRIHNDFILGEETHRLLIQLNRGWEDEQGGFLMIFNSEDPADVAQVFTPSHDSVFGFAISEASHHAVSTIHGGERFTLVFSFYGDDAS